MGRHARTNEIKGLSKITEKIIIPGRQAKICQTTLLIPCSSQ